ncbi:SanA/YdcF family protein [Demequina oxidasica]|uniref:SanA/YdcF family protein n=1 Tax=Demequina oxidasica TaxID=676199 RepID=UPI000785C358|nr:ElyC/SanA/YdcF family protein [Demequina oxidasica]
MNDRGTSALRIAGSSALALGAAVALPTAITRFTTAASVKPVEADFAHANAALILGARVWPDGRPSRFLRERVETGVELFKRGLVDSLIMSGDGIHAHSYDEPAVMTRVAIEMGVPASAITADPRGVDTYSSAHRARHVYGVTSAIAVSQEFHLPRAVWLCERLGISAQGAYPPVIVREHTAMGYVRETAATVKAFLDVAQRRVPDGTT